MRRTGLFCILVSCALSATGLAENGPWEAQGALEMIFPSGDLWDQAMGGELKLIYWRTPRLGFALSAGISQWSADEKTVQVSPEISQAWGGDAMYIPLGVSVLGRWILPAEERLSFTLEGGLRYYLCNSSLTLTETVQVPTGPGGSQVERDTYAADCDGGIVARIGGGAEWNLFGQSKVFLVGGYQLDLDKGEAAVDWIDARQDVELGGFFAQIGAAIPF